MLSPSLLCQHSPSNPDTPFVINTLNANTEMRKANTNKSKTKSDLRPSKLKQTNTDQPHLKQTGEVNNFRGIIPMQSAAGKPWFLVFMWMATPPSQQDNDNAPRHSTKTAQERLKKHYKEPKLLTSPPNSTDPNPIQHQQEWSAEENPATEDKMPMPDTTGHHHRSCVHGQSCFSAYTTFIVGAQQCLKLIIQKFMLKEISNNRIYLGETKTNEQTHPLNSLAANALSLHVWTNFSANAAEWPE